MEDGVLIQHLFFVLFLVWGSQGIRATNGAERINRSLVVYVCVYMGVPRHIWRKINRQMITALEQTTIKENSSK